MKTTIEELPPVDLYAMRRAGVFDGVSHYETDGLALECRVEFDTFIKRHGGDPEYADIALTITLDGENFPIAIERKPSTVVGERWYALCPNCDSRCYRMRITAWGLACRKCCGARYFREYAGRFTRLLDREMVLVSRLDNENLYAPTFARVANKVLDVHKQINAYNGQLQRGQIPQWLLDEAFGG